MQSQTRQMAESVGFCAAEWPAQERYGEVFGGGKTRNSALLHERTVNAGLWSSSSGFSKQGAVRGRKGMRCRCGHSQRRAWRSQYFSRRTSPPPLPAMCMPEGGDELAA